MYSTPPPPCPSPPLVLPQVGVGDRHLVKPKRAKPPPKGVVQSIPVESGEHVQEGPWEGALGHWTRLGGGGDDPQVLFTQAEHQQK